MYSDFKPKFAKRYVNAGEILSGAFKAFNEDVKSEAFPTDEHSFKIDESVMNDIIAWKEENR